MCIIVKQRQTIPKTALVDKKVHDLKECEKFNMKTKKYLNFKGVQRPMGIMDKNEYDELNKFWLSFWKNTFLGINISDIYSREGRAQFKTNVHLWGSMLTALSLFLILETSFRFNTLQVAIAAAVGYYVSAITFGIAHMSLHAKMLDYHWKGSRTAFYVFAYSHHRSHQSADTFTNQILVMTLPSARPEGLPYYEYFKFASLFYFCFVSSHARLLLGWFLLSWIMEAAGHHASHGQTRCLPPLVRAIVQYVYNPLGLIPSKEHHHKHHDYSQETRFSNFTDLSAPLIDIVLNKTWDMAYHTYFEKGQLHDKGFSLSGSWIIVGGNIFGAAGAWLVSKCVGLDASYFCLWNAILVNVFDPLRIYCYYRQVRRALVSKKMA